MAPAGRNPNHSPIVGHRRDKRHGRPRGFTLLELLVVAGIIGLLIAILIPSLNYAREHSRFTVCQANLHAQLQAHAIYSGYFSDQKPPFLLPSFTPGLPPLKTSFNDPDTKWFNIPVGQGILVNVGLLKFESLLCPSGSLDLDRQIDETNWSTGISSGSSYVYYWRDIALITSATSWNDPVTYTQCVNTQHSALIMDVNLAPGHTYTGEYAGRAWVSHPVMEKTNIGFLDGSVQAAPDSQVVLQYPTDDFNEANWWAAAELMK